MASVGVNKREVDIYVTLVNLYKVKLKYSTNPN